MAKKQALGKGLSALIPGTAEDAESDLTAETNLPENELYQFTDRARRASRVAEIELDRISPNPYQPRETFDEKALEELAASIRELGLIQPITVREIGDDRFQVISGERRVRAARLAGMKRIPAHVRTADSEAMLELAIVENIQREDLDPIEEAQGYQRLIEECGLNQTQVADKVGKDRATVSNVLRLLRLPGRVQSRIRDRTISSGHARSLLAVDDLDSQLELLAEIEAKGLSVRQVENRVRALRRSGDGTRTTRRRRLPDDSTEAIHLDAFRDRLRTHLGTRVAIRNRANGAGRIEIEYYSREDLERVLDILLRPDHGDS